MYLALSARDVPRPVDAIRLLASFGLGLRRGSEAFDRMFMSDGTPVDLVVPEGRDAVAELAALGVSARPLERRPVAAIREGLGLSRSAFAARFGLDLDIVRDWEEGHSRPDPVAAILLRVIERDPAAVDAALTVDPEPVAPGEA